MNPIVVFVAVYAFLTLIRHRLFARRRHVQDHEALVRAKAALVVMVHMQSLLEAVDKELARRGKEVTPC